MSRPPVPRGPPSPLRDRGGEVWPRGSRGCLPAARPRRAAPAVRRLWRPLVGRAARWGQGQLSPRPEPASPLRPKCPSPASASGPGEPLAVASAVQVVVVVVGEKGSGARGRGGPRSSGPV